MTTGIVYDPVFLNHDTGAHVENSQRLLATIKLLGESRLLEKLAPLPLQKASLEEISEVHSSLHINTIHKVCQSGGGWLDGDTYASPESFEVALYAAGGMLSAVDAVMTGQVKNAFALIRPPGHHATSNHAMGFCLFNNIAIAAKYALKNHDLQRVLIVDFDVHHGNGTEEIFYTDPAVLYFSTHQYPHYPGTGAIEDTGAGEGKGTNVNVPLPAYCGDMEYQRVYQELLVPIARRFQPQLVLLSAGYDLHWADQLSGMQLTVDGIGRIVDIIKGLAEELCKGRLVLALEGG